MKSCLIFFIFLLQSALACSQILIDSDGFDYQQSFDLLDGLDLSWSNGNTIAGWYASNSNGLLSSYNAGAGSSSSSGIWSYGSDLSADRALGSLNQNSSGDIVYGALFQNNSGVVINSITLSFRAEQWRKVISSTKGYQRVKIGYKIGSLIDLSAAGLFDNSYAEVPESYMITLDSTTTATQSMNGNAAGNFANVSVVFPVLIDVNQQFFLRFYDENVSGLDMAMAVDDLQIIFSAATTNRIFATSDYNFFPYMDQGILTDIPAEGTGHSYIIPTAADAANWTPIIQNFNSQNWNSLNVTDYGYQVAEFYDQIRNKRYYVLRKTNLSLYFWGTFVNAQNPSNAILVVQAPHPIQDTFSDREAAAVFEFTGAHSYMVAGISRCASDLYSSCSGQTSICGTLESFRKSDLAHNSDSMFHLATTLLGDDDPALVFLQLHGFGKGPGDPDFIVSCGTINARDKSVPDRPVQIREGLLSINSGWQVKVVHTDNYNVLGALDNVQGRYLNLYPYDDCTSTINPLTVTNRFLHIEQFFDVRKYSIYYSLIATAINNVINSNPYTNYIPITESGFQYAQNFNAFATSNVALSWGNNLSIPGWYSAKDDIGLFSYYRHDDGSDVTGALYSYGNTNSSDRSLGSLNDDTSGNIMYGVLFKNTSNTTLSWVNLQYDVKQWRDATNSSNPQKVMLSYQIAPVIDVTSRSLLNNANFTNVPAGDMSTIDNTSADGAIDGEANLSSTNIFFPVTLQPNEEIFIRFYDPNESGLDRALAIDNFNIVFSIDESLPIEWASLNITTVRGFPLLQWTTTNEVNCSRYEILKSTNGVDFEKKSQQKCLQGIGMNQYQYLDTLSGPAKTFYYRIAQYDEDGQVSYSSTLRYSRQQFLEPKLWVKEKSLHIETDYGTELQWLFIYDMMGQILYSGVPASSDGYSYEIECMNVTNQVLIVKAVFNDEMRTCKIVIRM